MHALESSLYVEALAGMKKLVSGYYRIVIFFVCLHPLTTRGFPLYVFSHKVDFYVQSVLTAVMMCFLLQTNEKRCHQLSFIVVIKWSRTLGQS